MQSENSTSVPHMYGDLTHWGWVMHICINKLTIIGSDNGLLSGRHKAIIWTNAGILFIWVLGTNQWYLQQNSYIFIQENMFKSVICEMAITQRAKTHSI